MPSGHLPGKRNAIPPKQQKALLGWGIIHPGERAVKAIDRATCQDNSDRLHLIAAEVI